MKQTKLNQRQINGFLDRMGSFVDPLAFRPESGETDEVNHIRLEGLPSLEGFGGFSSTLDIHRKDLPWIATLIYQCRVDLQESFNLDSERGLFDFVVWLVSSAHKVNVCLVDDPDFLAFCSRRMFASSALTIIESVVYLSVQELQDRWVFPSDEQDYRMWFESTFRRTGSGRIAEIAKTVLGERSAPKSFAEELALSRESIEQKPFGVNVVGYAYGQLGIGEDARMTAIALEELGIPCCMVNFNPGHSIPQHDFSMHHKVVEQGPYQINLFCMTATETARYFCFEGRAQFIGRHNIAYWPWELDKWPKNWLPVNDLIDEVWVASQHIADALVPVCQKPVTVVPLHVRLGPISPLTRADYGLPESAKLYCFSFDLHSSVYRKNPEACLNAFLRSFPKEDPRFSREHVGLVIKTHQPSRFSQQWEDLKAMAAQDDRIHILEHTLNRPDLLALYRCCDCFISLHRAEGFGRGIAEAILLGLEVVTTNYSGNLEFCHPPQCQLVDCELVPVQPGEYIECEGMRWAGNHQQPSLDLVRRRFPLAE